MEVVKAIITAMKEEWDLIVDRFDLKEVKKLQNITIYEGVREVDGEKEKIVLANSWIGKIQSAIATSYVLENYDVEKLVNVWIAWNIGWNDDIKVWDVFLPNAFIQHDFYLPFEWEEYDYGKAPIFLEYAVWSNYDLKKFGLILSWVCLSGDTFVDDPKIVWELRDKHGADIVEMEAFAVLSVAREYNILDKCVVIKALSDGGESKATDECFNNLDFAMNNSIDVLELIL